jgi:hypothetical protein
VSFKPVVAPARSKPDSAFQILAPQQPPQAQRLLQALATNESMVGRRPHCPSRAADSIRVHARGCAHDQETDAADSGKDRLKSTQTAYLERHGAKGQRDQCKD